MRYKKKLKTTKIIPMCSIISTCERHRRQVLQYEQIAHIDIKIKCKQRNKKYNNLNPLSIAEKKGIFFNLFQCCRVA